METDIKSGLESLLFVSGEEMSFGKLSKVTGEKEDVLRQAAEELAEEYRSRRSGIRLVVSGGKLQLVSCAENSALVEKLLKIDIEGDLSRSALETVSIVAYRGPLTRAEIEEIRGVNTSFTLRQLSIRGLVEKMDNPHDARSYLYRISFDFLRHLGLERIEDLPRYQELREKELISEQIAKNEGEAEMPAGAAEGTREDDGNDKEARGEEGAKEEDGREEIDGSEREEVEEAVVNR